MSPAICNGDCYTGCACGDVPDDSEGCNDCGCRDGCVCDAIHDMRVEQRHRRMQCWRESRHRYSGEYNGKPTCWCRESTQEGPGNACRECLKLLEECQCLLF